MFFEVVDGFVYINAVRHKVVNIEKGVHYIAGLVISKGSVKAYVQIKSQNDIVRTRDYDFMTLPCYDLAKQQNTMLLDHTGGFKEVFQRQRVYTTLDLMYLKEGNPELLDYYQRNDLPLV